ncbi:MAG: Hsp20/alpha crystallin family protein [Actinomycetota bacterium]
MRNGSLQGSTDFEDLLGRLFGSETTKWPTGGFDVPSDIFHNDEQLVVRMDLPGVAAEDVEVTVQENVLVINGSRRFPFDRDKVRFLRRGTFYGDFTQRIQLGKGLDVEKVSARFDDGVLQVSIPVAEEVQPRKISIEVGDKAALSG